MFGDEKELTTSIKNTMRIAIINPNTASNDISIHIFNKLNSDTKNRIKISLIPSVQDLYKLNPPHTNDSTTSQNGLINKKWISDIMSQIPSVILFYYHIEPGANKENEEKKIYENIQEIKKYDPYLYIYLFIICKDIKENPYNFIVEDKLKKYCLRNLLNKEFLFVFQDEDIWNYLDFIKFCGDLIFYARNYYKKLKRSTKEKKDKCDDKEDKIKYNVILEVLSIIKSNKNQEDKLEYLEEAYEIITDENFDIKNYKYGSGVPKYNFFEIRSVADWIFFKIIELEISKLNKIKSLRARTSTQINLCNLVNKKNIDGKIKKFLNHIKIFSNKNYYENNDKDPFHFVEYYWLFKRYGSLSDFIENFSFIYNNDKVKIILLGSSYLEKIYNTIRMIKYYEKYFLNQKENGDLFSVIIDNKEIDINYIEKFSSDYYGTKPNYYLKDSNNNDKNENNIINFTDEIYIKKFMYEYNIGLNEMLNNLKNKLLTDAINTYHKYKISDNIKTKGLDVYINMLKITSLIKEKFNFNNINNFFDIPDIINTISDIYNCIFEKSTRIKKFPKVYLHIIQLYTDSLIYRMNKDKNLPINSFNDGDKINLFINLSKLMNIKKLNENEEKIFFNLLNDEKLSSKATIDLDYNFNKNGNGIFFEYNIKDINTSQYKKILDIAEYKFDFYTTLSQEKIKFNNIKCYYECIPDVIKIKSRKNNNNQIINIIKEFTKEDLSKFDFDINSPLNLENKILIKHPKSKLILSKIEFSFVKKENILYIINIPKIELSKTIFITNLNKNVLNFKFPSKNYISGVNQLFKLEYEVCKDPEIENNSNIKVSNYKIKYINETNSSYNELNVEDVKISRN